MTRRDPFGVRPVYVGDGGRTAPSVWQLAPRGLDRAAARARLAGTLAEGATIFAGVRRVPPGHELQGDGMVIRWWTPPDPTDTPWTADDLLARLRVASAGASAFTLSGGVDSSLLLALAPAGACAYTIADDFADDDRELARARAMAAACGAIHREVRVTEAALPDALASAVIACEDVLWNGRAVAGWLLFRAIAAAGEREVASGIGADEVLLGNPAALSSSPPPSPPSSSSSWSSLAAAQRNHLATTLPDSILPIEQRMARAHGVTLLAPYLDPSFAESALRAPHTQLLPSKQLLRDAAAGLVPDAIRLAPKEPRLAPAAGRTRAAADRWLAVYDAWLSPARLRALDVVDPAHARALLDELDRLPLADPRRAAVDRELMMIVSLAILHDRVERP